MTLALNPLIKPVIVLTSLRLALLDANPAVFRWFIAPDGSEGAEHWGEHFLADN